MVPYVESDCTIVHNGREFTAGGAFVTAESIVAYPAANGVLTDWHGRPIGTWRAVATWQTPRSYLSPTMSQIEARVGGRVYTGRGAGEGMIFRGRAKRF